MSSSRIAAIAHRAAPLFTARSLVVQSLAGWLAVYVCVKVTVQTRYFHPGRKGFAITKARNKYPRLGRRMCSTLSLSSVSGRNDSKSRKTKLSFITIGTLTRPKTMDRQQIAPQNSQVAPRRIRCLPMPPGERAQYSSNLPAIEPAAQFYQMVPLRFNQGAPPKPPYSIEYHAGLRQGHLNIEDRVLPAPYTDPRAADRGRGRGGGVFPLSEAV
ncbi:hypothetical protein QBC33DRAFT_359558 [Phialemonium atrogriseum]|uniref:Uncharacterized protein n=1 Tax=Phialemonium atrogriseum TaxID=1093897 RepID=A0AAJ0C4W2_9PEZI|nr:uncharacterized protein QBC33DRAFT_359558 [Phialemonium atrogriseum]KAK1768769.1 hypothetical protein QBC33DRAFT_359558 [Phialemonium atrogriseum]